MAKKTKKVKAATVVTKKKAFSRQGLAEKVADYHGTAMTTSVQVGKSINMQFTLEEALKLREALTLGIQSLMRLNRTKTRAMGLHLRLMKSGLSVIEREVSENAPVSEPEPMPEPVVVPEPEQVQ